jgi:hypothetical protein
VGSADAAVASAVLFGRSACVGTNRGLEGGVRATLPKMNSVVIKKIALPDEVRTFKKGRFELVEIGGLTLGRATNEPGWKWSVHVGPVAGTASCQVSHVGLVLLQGRAMVRMDGGAELKLEPGDAFAIPPGHDSWVLGEETYVSLHFLGADAYAK